MSTNTSSTHSSPPTNFKQFTSNSVLVTPTKESVNRERERKVSGRGATHLQTGGLMAGSARLGSRTPSSIPSSPTSVYVPFYLHFASDVVLRSIQTFIFIGDLRTGHRTDYLPFPSTLPSPTEPTPHTPLKDHRTA